MTRTSDGDRRTREVITMLAEKFFLVLETLRSHASDDSETKVFSRDQQSATRPDQTDRPAAPKAGPDAPD